MAAFNDTSWRNSGITLNDTIDNEMSIEANPTLPPELRFNNNALAAIIVYSALFVVAAVGNLTVFVTLCRNRHRKSRINLMIMHLAIADMVVTFIMIPLEVGWRATTQWLAGNAACKVFFFLRAFGLYLSSMVLVCVSLDRYFAILYPLRVTDARRRGKIMLMCAWAVSIMCSIPQSIVFHVSRHPVYKDYVQCVTFGFFSSQTEETAYNLFCVLVMYFIPLLVICFAYTRILWEISKKSKESKDDWSREGRYQGRMRLRRSDMSNIERARARTLRMTVIIVLVFIWCWTPYVVMTLWYMFDRESATLVDDRVQDALFIMAVSNSCMNPLVYGTYAMNFKQEFQRCLGCACFRRNKQGHQRNNTGWLPPPGLLNSASPGGSTHAVVSLMCGRPGGGGGVGDLLVHHNGAVPARTGRTNLQHAAARLGDALSSHLSAANSNVVTRSTGLPGGAAVGAVAGHNLLMTRTTAGGKMLVVPDVLPDFMSNQVSCNSRASESGEYSHGSVAFYSEPLQCGPDPEEDMDEEENADGISWWQSGGRTGRHRGLGSTASTRVRSSPSADRLEGLRRWQGTTEVHRLQQHPPPACPPSSATNMGRSPRL